MNTRIETQNRQKSQDGERGNVLFLILIAVALFAALSYAVTQSTRSGGGDASRETNLVNSAQITQYPAAIKTAIIRMMVSNGTSVQTLQFNPPAEFAALNPSSTGVFVPPTSTQQGGGATYQLAPSNVLTTSGTGQWVFNGENQIMDIGSTTGTGAPTASTADVIAFLPNVTQAICEEIHRQLGLTTTIPVEDTTIEITKQMASGPVNLGSASDRMTESGSTINGTGSNELRGQPQGCFQQPSGTYIYYHVLVER